MKNRFCRCRISAAKRSQLLAVQHLESGAVEHHDHVDHAADDSHRHHTSECPDPLCLALMMSLGSEHDDADRESDDDRYCDHQLDAWDDHNHHNSYDIPIIDHYS